MIYLWRWVQWSVAVGAGVWGVGAVALDGGGVGAYIAKKTKKQAETAAETKKSIENMTDQPNDNVNHPAHYTSHPSGVECITIARHYCFSIGNAIKYLWRAGLKQDADKTEREKEIEDLEKAVWYIQDRIRELRG